MLDNVLAVEQARSYMLAAPLLGIGSVPDSPLSVKVCPVQDRVSNYGCALTEQIMQILIGNFKF